MRHAFEQFNSTTDEDVRRRIIILSMDVIKLYPSLQKEVCKRAIKWLIGKSDISLENIDWVQIVRYVAVNMSAEEIAEEGLTDVIPGRAKQS